MSDEYNGVVYDDTKKKWGEIDPVYPEKQQPYVPLEQCGHPHNYLNGWKCINCGHIAPIPDQADSIAGLLELVFRKIPNHHLKAQFREKTEAAVKAYCNKQVVGARRDELIWATGASSLSKEDAKIFTDRIAELAPQPPMGKHTPTGTVYDAFPPTNKPHTGKGGGTTYGAGV